MNREMLTSELDREGLELVIGVETHVRLNTKSKLFCGCPNEENIVPNQNICSVCTGQMGVLPALNKEAIGKAILFGKAVQSTMSNEIICWDRKHYEYPDQPKNFQLTQFQKPIIPNGHLDCFRNDGSVFRVEIEQVHIEEDAAKLVHEKNQTLVDFNKSGVPLIEIVTKPCIHQIADVSTFAQNLQRIVQNIQISDANLEKGEFKSDISISLRKKGTLDLNPRTEIKNLNSFKFMTEALEEEISKQLDYYQKHKKPRPDQTTVLWDADLKQTKTMRKKEFAADYRFVLEPDIPFVNIKPEIESIKVNTKLLPFSIEKILIDDGVLPQDAKYFTTDAKSTEMFLSIYDEVKDASFVAKTLSNNLKPEEYDAISTLVLSDLFKRFKKEEITLQILQKCIGGLIENKQFDYTQYIQANSVSEDQLVEQIKLVIEQNQVISAEIGAGNQGKAGILVGKVIAKIGNGASGKVIREKILQILAKKSEKATERESSNENLGISNSNNNAKTDKEEQEAQELRETEIIIKEDYRTHKISQLSEENLSHEVILSGWVSSLRDHGELVFIDFRDSSHQLIQIRLDRQSFPNLDELAKLKAESVLCVTGQIVSRQEDDFNPSIRTGKIELNASKVEILNLSRTLPFELKRANKSNENIRFRYKFLDHRSEENRQAIVNRHRIIKLLRDLLDEQEFLEIETPILTSGTDEGAREFIVPSRKFPGSFYTLPQAPQQFKQMLMVGGFEKYFQIARCFRDEDSRGDRQPEFTQLDIEMAFVSMQDVIDLNTKLLNKIITTLYGKKWKLMPFKVITYKDAIDKYGSDRPDLRFGLEMEDITSIVKETTFQVFAKPIEDGGIVKCIKVKQELQEKGRISKGQIEKLTAIAQENGLGGLAYIIVNENNLQSPIIKFLGEDIAEKIVEKTQAKVGDIVFFSAADAATANKALDAVRQELGKLLKLIKSNELHPAWVVDFPFFEKTEEGNWTFTHNPFSMPRIEFLKNHMKGENIGKIIAQQYDLILNGFEIGGGSVRAHKAEILEATYRNMGYDKQDLIKSVGHMYEAFHYGAPPHAGIAWGVDRLVMILEKKNSIREVIAFPKTGAGEDLLFKSPSQLSEKKIREANVTAINVKKL